VDDIDNYTYEHWGARQAKVYLKRLQRHIEGIALKPSAGRACPAYRPGYYRSKCGAHVVFYRLTDNGVEVVRILHEAMDFGTHL